jgi:hypothetical protein
MSIFLIVCTAALFLFRLKRIDLKEWAEDLAEDWIWGWLEDHPFCEQMVATLNRCCCSLTDSDDDDDDDEFDDDEAEFTNEDGTINSEWLYNYINKSEQRITEQAQTIHMLLRHLHGEQYYGMLRMHSPNDRSVVAW